MLYEVITEAYVPGLRRQPFPDLPDGGFGRPPQRHRSPGNIGHDVVMVAHIEDQRRVVSPGPIQPEINPLAQGMTVRRFNALLPVV